MPGFIVTCKTFLILAADAFVSYYFLAGVLTPEVTTAGSVDITCSVGSCGKSFRSQRLLDYHIKYHHAQLPSSSTNIRRRCKTLSTSSVGECVN